MSWIKIERTTRNITLRQFAEENKLTAIVRERPVPKDSNSRYYARFEGADEKGPGVLIGTYGDGITPDAALAAYARTISNKTLVIDAFKIGRREIDVPNLWHEPEVGSL